jgi:hypothetical protein
VASGIPLSILKRWNAPPATPTSPERRDARRDAMDRVQILGLRLQEEVDQLLDTISTIETMDPDASLSLMPYIPEVNDILNQIAELLVSLHTMLRDMDAMKRFIEPTMNQLNDLMRRACHNEPHFWTTPMQVAWVINFIECFLVQYHMSIQAATP